MTIIHDGKKHEVFLEDDGTLDTVITVDGKQVRFDCEYASEFRKANGEMTIKGLRTLALEAINDAWLYDEEVR